MKKLISISILFLVFSVSHALACHFEFTVDEASKKASYKVGDVVVVKVKATFTHKVCPVAITQTKFDVEGLKIDGATDWKELSPGVYERKMKLKVIANDKAKYEITASRTCDKNGGVGTFKVPVEGAK